MNLFRQKVLDVEFMLDSQPYSATEQRLKWPDLHALDFGDLPLENI